MSSLVEYAVPVVEGIDAQEFAALVTRGRPVLIRGAVADWPALDSWTLDSLRDRTGHRRVPVEFYEGSWFGPWETVEMTMQRYLEVMASDGDPEMCYLAQTKLDEYLPELVDDITVPELLAQQPAPGAAFFLGRESVTALHYHTRDEALLCMVGGRKEVTLYAPHDFDRLGYHPWPSYRFNFSRIDFTAEPETDHPELLRAQPYRVVVEPGDALFIPLYWSHWTRNLDLGTSVTFFWPSRDNLWTPPGLALRSKLGYTFRDQVSVRTLRAVERVFGFA